MLFYDFIKNEVFSLLITSLSSWYAWTCSITRIILTARPDRVISCLVKAKQQLWYMQLIQTLSLMCGKCQMEQPF